MTSHEAPTAAPARPPRRWTRRDVARDEWPRRAALLALPRLEPGAKIAGHERETLCADVAAVSAIGLSNAAIARRLKRAEGFVDDLLREQTPPLGLGPWEVWIMLEYRAGRSVRALAARSGRSTHFIQRRLAAMAQEGVVTVRRRGGASGLNDGHSSCDYKTAAIRRHRRWVALVPDLAELPRLKPHTRLVDGPRVALKKQLVPIYAAGVTIDAIATQIGRPPQTARDLVGELIKEGRVERHPRGCRRGARKGAVGHGGP
ncbi:MAG: hypothetical protein V7607_5419 [Solirubrobacteraceae bacterium]